MKFRKPILQAALSIYRMLLTALLISLVVSCNLDKPSGLLELELGGPLLEADQSRLLFRRGHTTLEILSTLKKAKSDPNIEGLVLKIGGLSAGLGKLGELHSALLDFKESGKPVYAFMEAGGNQEYFLSTAADFISLSPVSGLFLVGLRVEIPFYKGTLNKLGIAGEFLNVGEYKSANDIYTRNRMSSAQREELNAILDDLFGLLVTVIAQGRELEPDQVRSLVNDAPFSSEEAKNLGLVDELLYEDEFEDFVKEETSARSIIKWRHYTPRSILGRVASSNNRIAVVYANGQIMPGESVDSPLAGKVLGSATLAKALKKVREDGSIRAVVLRINSPGGSALASDLIWREVKKTSEIKPVIVSMSDVAASGGYWIATAADSIVANPGTITGSIGVISGKFQFRELYDSIDLNKEIIKRGDNATLFSNYTSFSTKERDRLMNTMQFIYENFLKKVSDSQEMSVEEVHKIARGRAWTGQEALEKGLVDAIGGLGRSISLAKEMSGIPADQRVGIVTLPKAKGLAETLLQRALSSSVTQDLQSLLNDLLMIDVFEKEMILALMPYRFIL